MNLNFKPSYWDKLIRTYDRTYMLNAVSLAVLTVALAVMSLLMMHRLSNRFHGLYTDYGCKLWYVIITQIISLLLGTLMYILLNYDQSVMEFFLKNDFLQCLQVFLLNLFTFQLPMATQLSCLFFGYIRHSRAKEYAQSNSDSQIPEQPAFISYFDPIVEYYTLFHGLQNMPEERRQAR